MAEKISVYVDEKLHRVLKAEAMDSVRESQEDYYSREDLLEMRKDGWRY